MKNPLLIFAATACLLMGATSCSTVSRTANTVPVATSVTSSASADLKVSPQKISYTLRPSKAVRRGGTKNVINTAVSEALKANGNADVLVGMQYEMKVTRNLFGSKKIKYVTVEGYPATYVNIHPTK